MTYIEVGKSENLSGSIRIQGAKNSVLPIMAAALLADGTTVIENCPDILDVRNTIDILKMLGCAVHMENSTLYIDSSGFDTCCIPERYSEKMRSSFIFMGPMLEKCKKAMIALPGGCNIGLRPVDIHLNAFRKMGVLITQDEHIYADGSNLLDTYINLEFPSVGATENILLLSAVSEVRIVIDNAAKELEIVDLCNFLNNMGADISGGGTSRIMINGVKKLSPVNVTIKGDRICAGTYIAAVGICGGDIIIKGINKEVLSGTIDVAEKMGISIYGNDDEIRAVCNERTHNVSNVSTGPYPEFPTDMQSQIMTLACVSTGNVKIYENVFENRFRIVPELIRMGADVSVKDNAVNINGVETLRGCEVTAYELRGGAALVLAGLAAHDITRIYGTEYIKRGYENLVRDLKNLGADIRQI